MQSDETEILSFDKSYLAEDYHQKYQLRLHRQLMAEFKAIYSRNIDLVNSTAAARANGHVGGHGEPDEIVPKNRLLMAHPKLIKGIELGRGERILILSLTKR